MLKKIILLWRYSCIYLWTLWIQKKKNLPHYYSYFEDDAWRNTINAIVLRTKRKASIRETKKKWEYYTRWLSSNEMRSLQIESMLLCFFFFRLFQFMVSGSVYFIESQILLLYRNGVYSIFVSSRCVLHLLFDTKFVYSLNFSITWIKNST